MVEYTERQAEEARNLLDRVLNELDGQYFTLQGINETTGAYIPRRGGSLGRFHYTRAHLNYLEDTGCIAKNGDGSYHVCRDTVDPCAWELLSEDVREELLQTSPNLTEYED